MSKILEAILSAADLSEADLRGADLSHADLSGTDLSGTNLSAADLSEADLSCADLSEADLRYADLSGADLSSANLSGTNLSGTNLSSAELGYAELGSANLSGADLSGADLRYANLSGADLSGANLSNADLNGADLSGTNLSGTNLSGTNLSGADLNGADLSRANLTPIRDDFLDILSAAPEEVEGLRRALIEGRIDGSTYSGECACLVGTIARLRGEDHRSLGSIQPDSDRPIERFFMAISEGDTPETNQVSRIVLSWLDEWVGNMRPPCGGLSSGDSTIPAGNPHFIEVQRRLADIIEIREGDGDSIAYTAIEDPHDADGEPVDNAADDLLEEINRALAPEYRASWTGDSNGDESDVVITLA